MNAEFQRVKAIFLSAMDVTRPAERAAFLAQACAGDAALRQRLEALLRTHDAAGSFLERPALAPASTEPSQAGQRGNGPLTLTASDTPPGAGSSQALDADGLAGLGPGNRLGPYQLLEQLGEGGMGVVYLAEQQEPVRRRVALKVIKPGMDSRQIIARFEAERQALALMDHPHIARVLDAGATEAGRPFFVMELVQGRPITTFCDEHRLSVRQRLELFVPVCQAVQHAHQKGIIHRDLKPSNILVAVHDGRPAPKVIDFGVGKATTTGLPEQTALTGLGTVVGTLEYMSPEQAELNVRDIDTRSDIYSLGVLLYELLTGSTPLERRRLREKALDEILRLIRAEEPPRPSLRLSASGERLATISAQRKAEPARLTRQVRGELDWIVMKCLEKDRGRRYETASALGRDVQRYLADEPVEAGPPSAGYKLRKLARKHRTFLTTAAAFVALLVAGTAVSLWQAVRATLAEGEATAARQAEARQAQQLAEAQREETRKQAERSQHVHEALTRATELRAQARAARGPAAAALTIRARAQVQRAAALLEDRPADADLSRQVRRLLAQLDQEDRDRQLLTALDAARLAQTATVAGESRFTTERAVPLFREALRAYGLPVGQGTPAAAAARIAGCPPEVRDALLTALDDWVILAQTPSLKLAEPHLSWLRAVLAAAEPEGWARQVRAAGDERDPARRRKALEELAAKADVGRLPPQKLLRLAQRLGAVGSTGPAVALLRRAQARHPGDFWLNHELGLALRDREPAEAVRYLTAAVALRPDSAGTHLNLGAALDEQGKLDEAAREFRRTLDLDPKYSLAHVNLGIVLVKQGKPAEAETALRQALALAPRLALAYGELAVALTGQGKKTEAIAACRQALDLDPNLARTHANLGNLLIGQGQLDEGERELRQAVAAEPSYALTHHNLANVQAMQGKTNQAVAEYRRAIALDPKLAKAHCGLSKVLRKQGKTAEALAAVRQALALDPKDSSAHVTLGLVLAHQDKLDEAIAAYHHALALDPKDALAHSNLGAALFQQGKVGEALAASRKALALDPTLAPAHNIVGAALVAQGQLDEGIAALRKALALDPKDARAHSNLGLALQRQGNAAEALTAHRRAIALDPTYAAAHVNLGALLLGQGKTDEAATAFRQAIALAPRDPQPQTLLGMTLGQQGKLDEAVAAFHKALAVDPRYPLAHLALGQALLGKGQPAEARASTQRCLELLPATHPLRAVAMAQLQQCERLLKPPEKK
jgi:tetratricopeptide (TPR) repeat protein/serine/threonine protein kinase